MRDLASEARLSALLEAKGLPQTAVTVHDTLPSTNDALRADALAGAPHGTVVWAHAQSAGKGSRGRSFLSPAGGLYFSVLLRSYTDPMQITCAAAVAVHEAIHHVLGIDTDIKWVNDLYRNGRKVCGILCEGITVGSTLSAIVLGVGINLVTPSGGFPPELAGIAGALLPTSPANDISAALLAEILSLLHTYLADSTLAYMHTYRARNLVLGRQVRYHVGETTQAATVRAITDRGTLLLQCADGSDREAFSGEVTL